MLDCQLVFPVTIYTRVKVSFKPNKMPLTLIKYFVKDAHLII